jgi:hypothetical protein
MKDNRIGIVSIATNKYLDFYFDLILSFHDNSLEFKGITFYLFTNRISDAKKFALDNSFLNIVIVEIPNLGWPDASLLRYRIFAENRATFDTDILVHLDADMLILRDPVKQFNSANEIMTFIRHPGYYFELSTQFLKFCTQHPKKIFSLFSSLVKFGGIGSWDIYRFSTAYVPRHKRKHYFCGAVWFARKSVFLDFCELLAEKTNLGLEKNYIPIWHDESYLNWFAAEQNHNELGPLFCSDGFIDNLFVEKPYIRAVEK